MKLVKWCRRPLHCPLMHSNTVHSQNKIPDVSIISTFIYEEAHSLDDVHIIHYFTLMMSSAEKLYDYDPASIQDPPDAAIAIHIRKKTTDDRLNDIDTTQINDRYGKRCTCSAELWKRIGIVSLYMITITILYADMNILAPNLSIIADEFGMDDDERDVKLGGLIALGFFFVGAPMSYYIGALADSDRVNRSSLFAATVFFGELGCLLAAFVKAYWQLYICR